MKNTDTPISFRAPKEWINEVKERAALHGLTFSELVRHSVDEYLKVRDLVSKHIKEETPVKRFLLVKINDLNQSSFNIYLDEQSAVESAKSDLGKLTKQKKERYLVFSVYEVEATETELLEMQSNKLDPNPYITRAVWSF